MHSSVFAQISAPQVSPTCSCFPDYLQFPTGQEHLFCLGHIALKPVVVVQALACRERCLLPLSVKQELIWRKYRIFSCSEKPQISNGLTK